MLGGSTDAVIQGSFVFLFNFLVGVSIDLEAFLLSVPLLIQLLRPRHIYSQNHSSVRLQCQHNISQLGPEAIRQSHRQLQPNQELTRNTALLPFSPFSANCSTSVYAEL